LNPLPSPKRLSAVQDFGRRGYAQAVTSEGFHASGHPKTALGAISWRESSAPRREVKTGRISLLDIQEGELKRGVAPLIIIFSLPHWGREIKRDGALTSEYCR
jgi:hypothetical protein